MVWKINGIGEMGKALRPILAVPQSRSLPQIEVSILFVRAVVRTLIVRAYVTVS